MNQVREKLESEIKRLQNEAALAAKQRDEMAAQYHRIEGAIIQMRAMLEYIDSTAASEDKDDD